jgi:Xaa-Pro aminopeptidase
MIAPTAKRIARLREKLPELKIDGLYVTDMLNIRWLTGFTGSAGYAVVTPSVARFYTDFRYMDQAAAECPDFEIVKLETRLPEETAKMLIDSGSLRLGFEAGNVTYKQYTEVTEKIGDALSFVATNSVVEKLRQIKDETELAWIQRACVLADKAYEFIQTYIKPGVAERDVMFELETFIRRQDGAEPAFGTIVASGPRGALPHGRASDRIMQSGELVTLDFGARLGGYCSDITRTVALESVSDEQRRIYDIVHEALHLGIANIKPGVPGKEVDAIVREFIASHGHGEHFGHGLGHGLGLYVHDHPGMSKTSELTLEAGMVVTVEPGIYVPGFGGVRIEHDVLVTDSGGQVLTHSTTELLVL